MEKNTGKVREFCQPGEVGTLKKHMVSGKWLTYGTVDKACIWFLILKY